MNYANHPERERILNEALRARTLSEIMSANHEMDQWVADHPEDLGIRDAYEVLDNMQEIAEFQQQEELSRRSPAELVR
jgi:hypothetical protein